MVKIKKILPWLLLLSTVLLVFHSWFGVLPLSAGDATFYFRENLDDFNFFPYLWQPRGLGEYSSLLYAFPFFGLPLKIFSFTCLSWPLVARIIWYFPFLIFTLFSSWYIASNFLSSSKFKFLSCFIYLLNSYILMIVGGGQVSVFLAYAIAPLTLGLFINLLASLKIKKLKSLILAGITLAIQVGFEPRIALITMGGVVIYYLLFIKELKNWRGVKNLILPVLITFSLHFYWILPTILLRRPSFSGELTSFGWTKFLSFANFSKSLSLLHPNWPENIFGKTYLFKPEFLLLPILAFTSLLFINSVNKKNKIIIYFSLLGLFGAFLAKGVNPPFGEVYRWLFENVPGMNLFRDPTKFYLLIALSYSVLIPFSTSEIYSFLSSKLKIQSSKLRFKIKNYFPYLFLLFIVCYLLFLIRPALMGQLGGTFRAREVPKEYAALKDFLNNQNKFFRTFWVPKKQRFGFYSNNHPAINAENYVTDFLCREPFCSLKEKMPANWGEKCPKNDRCYVKELSYFLNPKTEEILKELAVKYVIVPYDSEGEIFIAEYQYNHQQREEVEEFLDTIPWLKKVEGFEKIAVYELSEYKEHFFIDELTSLEVNELLGWRMVNPTKYLVSLKIEKPPVNLVFSENYHEFWQAKVGEEVISSQPYRGILNSFLIDKQGETEILIQFLGEDYLKWGGLVSAMTFLLLVFLLVKLR